MTLKEEQEEYMAEVRLQGECKQCEALFTRIFKQRDKVGLKLCQW